MGYMRHHAIVVTSFDADGICAMHQFAMQLGCDVSGVVESPINGYTSFFVVPDGSKEGWEESNEGDNRRNHLIDELKKGRYDDGSSPFDWAEVRYGDDDGYASLTRSSDPELTTGAPE